MNTQDAVHTPVAVIYAFLLLTSWLVLLAAAIVGRGRDSTRFRGIFICHRLFARGRPSTYLPHDAGEALELEAASLPFAARFSGSIESSKASIDGSLIGFGA